MLGGQIEIAAAGAESLDREIERSRLDWPRRKSVTCSVDGVVLRELRVQFDDWVHVL